MQQHVARLVGSKTARNAASSFFTMAWLGALSIVALPLYIDLLGAAEWGVVAACASMQVLVALIDMGVSQIVPRWVAMAKAKGAGLKAYVRLFRRIYLGLSGFVFVFLQVSAEYLAYEWFQLADAGRAGLELCIRLISLQLLLQLYNNLHLGIWNGLQEQVAANVRSCVFGTLKHVTALLLIAFVAQKAWLYALVFAVVALLEVLFNALSIKRLLKPLVLAQMREAATADSFWREVLTLSGGILLGLLVSQMDRLVLSRVVPVEDFGVYVVVITAALALLQLQTPLTRAFFPQFVEDISRLGFVSKERLMRLLLSTALIATLPMLLLSAVTEPVLQFWLAQPRFVELGAEPLRILCWAVAVNSIYGCLYQVIVAAGRSYLVIRFNLAALMVAVIMLFFIDLDMGIRLGGVLWLVTASTQLLCAMFWWVFAGGRVTPKEGSQGA
jgi:O-antigen/teichoic acid export membrane protein